MKREKKRESKHYHENIIFPDIHLSEMYSLFHVILRKINWIYNAS